MKLIRTPNFKKRFTIVEIRIDPLNVALMEINKIGLQYPRLLRIEILWQPILHSEIIRAQNPPAALADPAAPDPASIAPS